MKPIKFKIACNYKNKRYNDGDILEKITKEDLKEIWRLNEKGFIEPLTREEFIKIQNKIMKPKGEDK